VGRIFSLTAVLLALFVVHQRRKKLGKEVVALLALWLGELLPDGGLSQGQRLLRQWGAERALGHHRLLSVVMPQT
jgi:hypothetical protein